MARFQPRADHIGSLRRPDALLFARTQFQQGTLGRDQLIEVEDASIADAITRQRESGIEVITDGEFRRDAWQTDVWDALEGFAAEYPVVRRTLADGTIEAIEMHTKPVEGRLRQIRRITGHEVYFLAD